MEKKRSFTILGTSIWRILAYFIIYSFIGYIIETVFAMVFYNVIESRKSFLYGPFCSIYGVGAVCLYVFLNRYFHKNNHLLFLGGFLIGSIVEYVISLIGEMCLGVRWWDYSNRFLNINGRICLLYSLFWGLLGLYFMKVINPKVDQFINYLKRKINVKILKSIVLVMIILLFVNCVVSGIAIDCYLTRQIVQNHLEVPNKEKIEEKYHQIYSNENTKKIIEKYFNDQTMVLAYPNLEIHLKNGETVRIREYLPDIKPYYYKFNKENPHAS